MVIQVNQNFGCTKDQENAGATNAFLQDGLAKLDTVYKEIKYNFNSNVISFP